MAIGRFAPSPTGRLHVGNLRTGLVAWLAARSTGSAFWLRFEDLDTASVRPEHYQSQPSDLLDLGLDWDEPVVRQSDRFHLYAEALDRLTADDAVYPCFCSRREIREAAQAPNGPGPNRTDQDQPGAQAAGHSGHRYPGTCRNLSSVERSQRAETRPPALRLRADGLTRTVEDLIAGDFAFTMDDFVVCRNDGTPAYHLVVVVDDDAQDVEQVVRADDLLESAARQIVLYERLGLKTPSYAHVPLVLGPDGNRLAKRHGAVTLGDRLGAGETPSQVLGFLAQSLGLCTSEEADVGITTKLLLPRFSFASMPTEPLTLPDDYLGPAAT